MEQIKLGRIELFSGGHLEPIEDDYISASQGMSGMWFVNIDNPYIYCVWYDKDDALIELKNEIAYVWGSVCNHDDDSLSIRDRNLKRALLNKFRYVY